MNEIAHERSSSPNNLRRRRAGRSAKKRELDCSSSVVANMRLSSMPAARAAGLRRTVTRYGLAALLIIAVAGMSWVFDDYLAAVPYAAFLPAVLAVAYFGGLGPGLFATALAILSIWNVLLPPHWSFAVPPTPDLVDLVLFAAISVACTLTQRALRESNAKLAVETKATMRFYEAGLKSWQSQDMREGLDEMLLAAIEMLGADMGNTQLIEGDGQKFRMIVHRGFKQEFLETFGESPVSGNDTASGRAFRIGDIVVIEDVEAEDSLALYRSVRRAAGFRAVVSAPLVNRTGAPLGMLNLHFRSPHRPSSNELRWLDLHSRRAADFIQRFKSEEALRESEARLRHALEAGGMATFDRDMKTGASLWSDEFYRLFGYRKGEVQPSRAAWLSRIHPEDREAAHAVTVNAERARRNYVNEFRIVLPDGEIRWLRAHGRFRCEGDELIRTFGLVEDITEARQQIETQRVLVAELQHRTRNLMAVVQSIAHQTLDSADTLAEFESRFDRRLQALSRVQSLLSRSDKEPITLGALFVMELEALALSTRSDRVTFGGPEAPLRKSAVEMLALALHELLTNAIKYGALASDSGRLSVTWHIEGKPPDLRLELEWIEQGIAPSPTLNAVRTGYGRTLIEQALPYSIGAAVCYELGAEGLRCVISLPVWVPRADEMAV
jgi:PAS domain S-box-containing protein